MERGADTREPPVAPPIIARSPFPPFGRRFMWREGGHMSDGGATRRRLVVVSSAVGSFSAGHTQKKKKKDIICCGASLASRRLVTALSCYITQCSQCRPIAFSFFCVTCGNE